MVVQQTYFFHKPAEYHHQKNGYGSIQTELQIFQKQFISSNNKNAEKATLRQQRAKLVLKMRRQIFRQIV